MSGKASSEEGVKVLFTPGGKPVKHGGSGAAYANYGCRCFECREANTERGNRRRAERRHEDIPEGVVHNASTYSNWSCRCDQCSADHSRKDQELAAKRALKRRLVADRITLAGSLEIPLVSQGETEQNV